MTTERDATPADHDCDACPLLHPRRRFLADAVRAVAITALALGASPRRAIALAANLAPTSPTMRGEEAAYPLPAQDGASIDRDREVILVRFAGAAYAFALSCPHQNTALRWEEGEHRFQCPKHHSKYRPDGTFIEGRATRGMDRYAIRREGDRLVVDLGTLLQQDENAAAWSAAVIHIA